MSRKNLQYLPLTLFILLIVAVFIWSLWFETLLPLIQAGEWAGLIAHLVGVPIILSGVALIIYGGFKTLRNIFDLIADEEFQRYAAIIQERPSRAEVWAAQRVHFRLWAAALWRGLFWMAAGFAFIGAGGYIINL